MSMLSYLKKTWKLFLRRGRFFFKYGRWVKWRGWVYWAWALRKIGSIYILFISQLVHVYQKFLLFYDSMFTKPVSTYWWKHSQCRSFILCTSWTSWNIAPACYQKWTDLEVSLNVRLHPLSLRLHPLQQAREILPHLYSICRGMRTNSQNTHESKQPHSGVKATHNNITNMWWLVRVGVRELSRHYLEIYVCTCFLSSTPRIPYVSSYCRL